MSDEKEVVEEVVEEVAAETPEVEAEPKEISQVLEDTIAEMRGDDEPGETAEPETTPESASEPAEEDFESSLSDRAQERFRELTDRARAAEESAANTIAQGSELYKIMQDSGVTPNDLTAYFEYNKASRQGNRAAADPYWKSMERSHSDFTGQKVGDSDPLTRYPDLQKQVEDLDVTETAARELAGLRDYAVRAQQYEQRQAEFQRSYGQQQKEQQEAADFATRASAELDRWSDEKKASDPQWELKEKLLLQKAQEVFPNIHPSSWPEFISREYAYLSQAFPEKSNGVSPNPIRPGVSGTTASPEAKSISDALDMALRDMRG